MAEYQDNFRRVLVEPVHRSFHDVFKGVNPVLGMIHLSGTSNLDRINRAMQELDIYSEEGVTGVIFENYHCSFGELENVLKNLPLEKWSKQLIYGVNVLPNEYEEALRLASQYNMDFIQLDYIAGSYYGGKNSDGTTKIQKLDVIKYQEARKQYPYPIVLGGVYPKYYQPVEECPGAEVGLSTALQSAMLLCEGIVVTGSATGKETPLSKIGQFREIMGADFPLIVGAGVKPSNVLSQLSLSNGCIVGSSFKPNGQTNLPVDQSFVQNLMQIIFTVYPKSVVGVDSSAASSIYRSLSVIDQEPLATEEMKLNHRLTCANESLNNSSFPAYLKDVIIELIKENELFTFPWKCLDCEYFNDQAVVACRVCSQDNPHYDSEKATKLLSSHPHRFW
jgi:predicted TIM-barrel enzyme